MVYTPVRLRKHEHTLTNEVVIAEHKRLQLVQPPKLLGDGTCINSQHETNAIDVAADVKTIGRPRAEASHTPRETFMALLAHEPTQSAADAQ